MSTTWSQNHHQNLCITAESLRQTNFVVYVSKFIVVFINIYLCTDKQLSLHWSIFVLALTHFRSSLLECTVFTAVFHPAQKSKTIHCLTYCFYNALEHATVKGQKVILRSHLSFSKECKTEQFYCVWKKQSLVSQAAIDIEIWPRESISTYLVWWWTLGIVNKSTFKHLFDYCKMLALLAIWLKIFELSQFVLDF